MLYSIVHMHYFCSISVFDVYFKDKGFLCFDYPRKSDFHQNPKNQGKIREIRKSDYETIPNNRITHVTKLQLVTM